MKELLRDAVRTYYKSVFVEPPPSLEKREFGVGLEPYSKITTRHMEFGDPKALNQYLREKAPFYISYSVGYFKFPSATPMENKILERADIVFEFDADEVGLFGYSEVWICERCGSVGEGMVERCPRCKSPVRVELFPSREREDVLKGMVKRLIDEILVDELGVEKKYIEINFSGNRGYHVHVRDPEFLNLDKETRIELASYVTGQSINPKYLFGRVFRCGSGFCVEGPSLRSRGWPGRVARAVYEILVEGRAESLKEAGIKEKDVKKLIENRFYSFIERGVWPAPQDYPLKVWIDIARRTAPLKGFTIDTSTTTDIHRLIRLPDSVHGTTGLIAKRVKDLKHFNPYRDAVALPSINVTLHVKISPEFEMKGKTFGPFKDEVVELPLYVAFYLIGRGVATWHLHSNE